jgi:ATP-dependent Zn protease
VKRKPTKRMRRTKAEMLSTAYHEAGHAVIALEMSMHVDSTTIRAHRRGGGTTWIDHSEAHLLDRTTVRFAGIAAEEEHLGISDDLLISGASQDFERVQDDFAYNRLTDEEVRVVWKQCATRAMHLVKMNWPAIDRVAKALYKHKRLNIDQLIHLIWVAK